MNNYTLVRARIQTLIILYGWDSTSRSASDGLTEKVIDLIERSIDIKEKVKLLQEILNIEVPSRRRKVSYLKVDLELLEMHFDDMIWLYHVTMS